MTSKEGVIWCWKDDSDCILFIFRENSREIEINLRHINSEYWYTVNYKNLLPNEKELLRNLKEELQLR